MWIVFLFIFFFYECSVFSDAFCKEARILAIVNNHLISNIDLDERIKLLKIISPSLEISKEDVLKNMIDERIFIDYKNELHVEVDENEVENAINSIDYAKLGIQYDTIYSQIKARLIWNKVLSKYVIPNTIVTEKEVNEYITHHIHEKNMIKLEKFVLQKDGDWQKYNIGWVEIKNLDNKSYDAIKKLKINHISNPIFLDNDQVKLKILDEENESVLNAHFNVKKLENYSDGEDSSNCALGIIKLHGSDFNSSTREKLIHTKDMGIIEEIFDDKQDKKYRLLLCGSSLKSDVQKNIFLSKVEKEQQKYIERLRNNSFIELKNTDNI